MEVIDVKVKKWGNSLGVVIPKEVIKNEEIGYSYWLLVQKRKCTSCGLTEIKKEVK